MNSWVLIFQIGDELRMGIRYIKNMTAEQKAEYDRIAEAIARLGKERNQLQEELEPFTKEPATEEQYKEYLLRVVALLEKHNEQFSVLTTEFRQLLIQVVATPNLG